MTGPITTRRARGMTLLEVLIATTILASLTLIVSTLWAQTKRWTDEAAEHGSALRLQRALDLLDRQWAARLLGATLTGGEETMVLVGADRLEFVTTEPALFPGWPVVKAVYTAEQQGAPAQWRLVYVETRLGTTDKAATQSATQPDTPPDTPPDTLTLTAGQPDAGPGQRIDEINIRRAPLVDLDGRPAWSVVLSEAQIAELTAGAGIDAASGPESEPTDGAGPRWIGLAKGPDRRWAGLEVATNPESVRLDGFTAEGGFQWALVGQPLR